MPVYGSANVDALLDGAAVVESFGTEPWELPEAEMLQITYEVAEAPALELTPPALHPSVPPYAAINVSRFPESPVGAFTLAEVRLVCRAGIRPRGLLLGGVCDSQAALDELSSRWGYRLQLGEVSLSRRHDRVRGLASVGGRVAIDVTMTDGEPIGTSDMTMQHSLHLVREGANDANGALVQVDPEFAVHSADRGRPVVDVLAGEALGTRDKLQLTYPVVAWTCRADTDLPRLRFAIDPRKPAFEGTRKLEQPAAA